MEIPHTDWERPDRRGCFVLFFQDARQSDKTQGAIGKRDVYRDGQVNSADVATPGSAPVATQAILESSEFKSLAKNQAFQELMKEPLSPSFPETSPLCSSCPIDPSRPWPQNRMFAELVRSDAFKQAVAMRSAQEMQTRMAQDFQF